MDKTFSNNLFSYLYFWYWFTDARGHGRDAL
jgi:hypothetical protein